MLLAHYYYDTKMRANEFINEASVGMMQRRRLQQRQQRYTNAQRTGLWFKGYRCTKDCSGHKAGYNWAKQKGVTATNQCKLGNSNSFWEGCRACGEGK